jgi:hypothetical protein
MVTLKHIVKDGGWSAFEHQCARYYNLPFTGLTLITLEQTYYTSISVYYLQIDTDTITTEEITNAVKKIKNGKAPGPDCIPPEVL